MLMIMIEMTVKMYDDFDADGDENDDDFDS